MPVYVQNADGQPLMPTKRFGKVRRLLKSGKAKVVRRCPFTIRLLYETGEQVQPVDLGIDAGSRTVGLSACTEKEEQHPIRIKSLSEDNFHPDSLDRFQRKQEVRKVYRRRDGAYVLADCAYTEDWDKEKKRSVAKTISGDDHITYLALDGDRVIGFISLLKRLEGPYIILDMMQVSAEYRGQGIGRRLFCKGKEEARKAGAEALYISACSSEETIAFYKAMGSTLTDFPIKRMADDEPCDLQMVCYLDD